ncbi:mandelate racemase/muconate lactonizing enzyme family protein [Brevibacterium sp.]|uniref:mandelate racemase/muconate lactonizing enzyme family protein n=1 Tax=Brevibacterium sp. TaxID=1701 RepID=UPI002810DC7C|nr:mandelate racemase/muconate lactonizing enzyme family protein [Brevibacterium sp.]
MTVTDTSPADFPGASTSSITRIEAWRVAFPVEDRRDAAASADADPFNAASPTFVEIESLILRVTTSDGIHGWGECFGHRSNPATMAALQSMVIPFALGRGDDPQEFSTAASRTFHPFGRGGPVAYAASGVDIALWDIAAKRAGLPLRRLLNVETATDEITGYASLPSFMGESAPLQEAVAALRERGFTHFKLHETASKPMAELIAAEPDLSIATDMNGHWDHRDIETVIAEYAHLGLWFLEEPAFPVSDMGAMAALREAGILTAAGENAGDVEDLLHPSTLAGLSIIQPSAGKIGGVSALERIYAATSGGSQQVMPHCYYYGPAFFATAQVIAAHPEYPQIMESPYFNWLDTLHPLQQCTANVTLPAEVGLGFDMNVAAVGERIIDSFSS